MVTVIIIMLNITKEYGMMPYTRRPVTDPSYPIRHWSEGELVRDRLPIGVRGDLETHLVPTFSSLLPLLSFLVCSFYGGLQVGVYGWSNGTHEELLLAELAGEPRFRSSRLNRNRAFLLRTVFLTVLQHWWTS